METEHFSHDHPLIDCSVENSDEEVKCYGCNLPVRGSVHGCKDCNFFLHKDCAQLPREFQHPYHRDHPLILKITSGQHFCLICCSPISGFNFCCDDCGFYLDARCASTYSDPEYAARMFQDGGHLFALTNTEPKTQYPCDVCHEIDDDTYLYMCVVPACPRLIHFRCAPFSLPETVKHKRHYHPLDLIASYVEDDLGEYYCEICETERNPKHPVYLCLECEYIGHVSCAIYEMLPSMVEEYEKQVQAKGSLSANDVTLGNLNSKIQEIQREEDALKHELERITTRIESLESIRAQYLIQRSKTSLEEEQAMAPR